MNVSIARRLWCATMLAGVIAFGGGAGLGWWSTAPAAETADGGEITVYKTPACGCCTLWVDHLKANGFSVTAHDVSHERLDAIRQEAGLPRELVSCHTGFVDGYLVEGHVPAEDIRELLRQAPPAVGIAVPGMPIGSPGMEIGDRRDPFDVILFDQDGPVGVFSSHHR